MSEVHPRRPVIAQSWRRSAMSGLAPDDRPSPVIADLASADPLLDAARPVLRTAGDEIADTGTALLLVDHDCRLVSRVFSGIAVERTLDGLGAARGATFAEDTMGTTALGTPAEVRGGITINGEEHYLDQFKSLSCYGQSIIHPATRRLVGIICMTEVGPRSNPLSAPFVNGLVAGIQDRLLDRSRADQRALMDAFGRAAPRRDIAVAAIGDDLQLTNALAADLLGPADFGTLRLLAAESSATDALVLTLGSGRTVEVVVERISGISHAALFRLRPAAHATVHQIPAGPRPPRTSRTVAVTGDPGTGRSTTAMAEAGDHVLVDVAASVIAARRVDLAEALGRARELRRTLVVDDADLLDESSIALLHKIATQPDEDAPALLIVTGPAAAARPSVHALIAVCRDRLDLAPLRQRPADIVSVAQRMLDDGEPGMSIGAAAADALASAEWPGNLTELRVVIEQAAAATRDRASRRVDLDDLPARYRTTSRAARLAGLEQAERQAIIDALDTAGHNKVHAAKALGISRTTLYSRIRALGIRS